MRLLNLFMVASMPVLKILLICALGSFLALDHIDILGESARKHLNNVVFFVFNPALVASNLAGAITLENIILLWFMPVNILLTYILGSILGWILTKITKAPQHLKGLLISSCAAGNMGTLPMILIPAICREKGSPFGAAESCHMYGMAYASLSMAIGAVYLWTYAYNIVRVSSIRSRRANVDFEDRSVMEQTYEECMLPHDHETKKKVKVLFWSEIWKKLQMISRKVNFKAIFAPSTIGAIVGFIIGLTVPLQKLMIGANAPLHIIHDSALLLGEAAIPIVTLLVGGNLLNGLRGSGVHLSLILGIIAIRFLLLPLIGIFVIKGSLHLGFVHGDPLYLFILLLQYAPPPAMNIGTVTEVFGVGQSECSVILLWTYSAASVSVTIWSAYFMWLVS